MSLSPSAQWIEETVTVTLWVVVKGCLVIGGGSPGE